MEQLIGIGWPLLWGTGEQEMSLSSFLVSSWDFSTHLAPSSCSRDLRLRQGFSTLVLFTVGADNTWHRAAVQLGTASPRPRHQGHSATFASIEQSKLPPEVSKHL